MTWIIAIIILAIPLILVVAPCMRSSNISQGKKTVFSQPKNIGYEAGEDD